ncbi:MAG: hypothetical protein CSB55_07430 [Candidatus Cloacimonadota bacterium]|nr:MAG: hypothetical protein CSB55_07430 [Candidatus Cloacimonadota bacterium]
MKKIYLTILILGVAVLFGKSSEKPQWLTDIKSKYPESLYLASIGKGDSKNNAENNAAANLARIFESKIKVDETTIQRYSELSVNNKTDVSEEMKSNKSVSVSSGQTLFNVKFGEYFTDETGEVFTVAYAERFSTGDIYEQKIKYNSEQTEFFLAKADKSENNFQKFAALSVAEIFAETNKNLLNQLMIISPETAEFCKPEYSLSKIRQNKEEAAASVYYSVDIKNDSDGYIKDIFDEMLTDQGFSSGEDPIIEVKGNIEFKDVKLNRPEKFISYRANISIKNKDKDIAFLRLKGREGSSDRERAQEIAFRSIQRKITREFTKKFYRYIDRLSD